MYAERWIQKELELINPMYFAVLNPHIDERINPSYGEQRWQIRKWLGVFPKRMGLWNTDASETILTLCDEALVDGGIQDIGYVEIDMQAIHTIRESHWWKLRWKQEVAAIDWHNDQLEIKANASLEEEGKMAARRIWHANREKDVFLDGQCNRWTI